MKFKYLGLCLVTCGLIFASGFSFPNSLFSPLQLQPVQAQLMSLPATEKRNQQRGNFVSASLNREFQLRINKTAVLDSENLQVKFVKVSQDSRCPLDAQCIWQGEILVVVNLEKNGKNLGDFELTSRAGSPELALKSFDDNSTIEVVNVKPERVSASEIKKSDYVVTLKVSKI